jgi:hypothetical protein
MCGAAGLRIVEWSVICHEEYTMNTQTIRRILTGGAAAATLYIAASSPAAAWPDPGVVGGGDGRSTSSGGGTTTVEVVVDDDALEYVQIGLGALAGMAVAGGAALGLRRLGHRAPQPA